MREKYDDLVVNKLYELYKIYEEYIWKYNGRKLIVMFQNNMISFYLYQDNQVVDELDISFDNKEEKLYTSICLKTFIFLLGNVLIYKDNNIYYNNKHKDYLRVIVKDNRINKIINELVNNQINEVIDTKNNIIKNNTKIKRKIYNKEFLNKLDTRIELSKIMLRGW